MKVERVSTLDILSDLISSKRYIFRSKDLREMYNWSPLVTYQRIRKMLDKGVIRKVWRGTFMINPKLLPNVPKVAYIDRLFGDQYYFGLYTAMSYWKISDLPTYTYQVVTVIRRLSGQKKRIAALKLQFVYVNARYFFGYRRVPYQGVLVNMSDLEKTLVDSTYFIGRHVIAHDLSKAVILAKNRVDVAKIIDYLRRLDSPFTNQRLGFLLEEIAKIRISIKKYGLKISNRYIMFDPKGPKRIIDKNEKWRILLNQKII